MITRCTIIDCTILQWLSRCWYCRCVQIKNNTCLEKWILIQWIYSRMWNIWIFISIITQRHQISKVDSTCIWFLIQNQFTRGILNYLLNTRNTNLSLFKKENLSWGWYFDYVFYRKNQIYNSQHFDLLIWLVKCLHNVQTLSPYALVAPILMYFLMFFITH